MFRIARAAGFAVASIVLVFGATYDPSRAWEVEASPVVPTYVDHANAAPAETASGVAESFASPAFDPNLTQAVTTHAVAPLESEPQEFVEGSSLADLVAAYASADPVDAEQECLAGAIYFESKGEPLKGQLAVAEVILNRVQSGKYPSSICGVVKQKSQFSFVRRGRIPPIPRGSEAWRKAVAVARIAQQDLAEGGVGSAMFFHARYVRPGWRGLTRVASIGNHIFYR